MNKFSMGLLLGLAALLIGLSQAFFIVDQREQAIVLQLGQPVGGEGNLIKQPGLHMKLPIVQEVRYFDRRVLSVDPAPDQVVISNQSNVKETTRENSENADEKVVGISDVSGEPIIVDSFARYKIIDPLRFLKTLGTVYNANGRLESILTDATRAVLGHTSLEEILSPQRNGIMIEIKNRVNASVVKDNLGIEIVDVRIVRADLTAELLTSTVRRMISELKERATETRAIGEEHGIKIRSEAEKERTVIFANAQRDAQRLRGEGDETAIRIYADAFNKDKEFYSFIRSLEAYENTFSSAGTQMILSPKSEFFKYFSDARK